MAQDIYYTNPNEGTPKVGQLCLCRCPDYCEEGYVVATFDGMVFDTLGSPNDALNEHVIGWIALTENGIPISPKKIN